MTREERNAYMREYRKKNKDKLKENNKKYYKTWVSKNKEKLTEYKSRWYYSNRDKILEASEKYREKRTHKPIVYLIVKSNYVGVTEHLSERLSHHKTQKGRDTSEVRILAQTETREQALEIESLLHDIGYNGKHINNMYQ